MTKKDYTAIASIINKRLSEKQRAPIGEYEVVEVLALDLAKHFQSENPRFNEDRFLSAVYGCPTTKL
jgi:hypothetical protein